MSRKSNQGIYAIMGFIWIGLALFGLIFDPEKRVIIISQIIVGLLCFILYVVSKLRKTKT
jgi:hypothetical protein